MGIISVVATKNYGRMTIPHHYRIVIGREHILKNRSSLSRNAKSFREMVCNEYCSTNGHRN